MLKIEHLWQGDYTGCDGQPNHLQSCGHKMNNSPRMAAAAMNTALFHIGNRPSKTPEKMKRGQSSNKSFGRTTQFLALRPRLLGRQPSPLAVLEELRTAMHCRRLFSLQLATVFGSPVGASVNPVC